jgi:hypothetical protein
VVGARPGRYRWVAKREVAWLAWLHRNRRLLVRDGRRPERHDAFLALGRAHVCWQCLHRDGLGWALYPRSAPVVTVGAWP